MTKADQQLVQEFFKAIAKGELPDDICAPDMIAWTPTTGDTSRDQFQMGVKLLSSLFSGTLVYEIDALTVQDDRIAAEVRSHGTFTDGEPYEQTHVFLFRTDKGQIKRVAEHMNTLVTQEKIMPRFAAAMSKAAK